MKYSDFIALVDRELREKEAWPAASSKLQEQVDRCFAAILAVAATAPLQRLPIDDETLVVTGSKLKKAALPDDLFTMRDDLGIKLFEFDSTHFRTIATNMSFESVERASRNSFQSSNILLSVDPANSCLWFTGATTVDLYYAPIPIKPATADIATTDVPLDDLHIEQAVQIVSAHVNGVTVKNEAGARFATILHQLYQTQGMNHV